MALTETTAAHFDRDVIERSKQRPVLVDFWADWCQPCRVLTPLLSALAEEYEGRLEVVKANVEELREIAGRYGVQSIPAVHAFVGGEPVDGFVGVQPPAALRSFADQVLDHRELLRAASLEAREPQRALPLYGALRDHRRLGEAATLGVARCSVALGLIEEAEALIEELERVGIDRAAIQRARALLDLEKSGGASVEDRQAAWDATPGDLDSRLELARALAAEGRHEEALTHALEIVRADRQGVGEAARRLMVDLFALLADDTELVRRFRRELASALY